MCKTWTSRTAVRCLREQMIPDSLSVSLIPTFHGEVQLVS